MIFQKKSGAPKNSLHPPYVLPSQMCKSLMCYLPLLLFLVKTSKLPLVMSLSLVMYLAMHVATVSVFQA